MSEQENEAINRFLLSLRTERPDNAFPHVSDCMGCDYATYSRRQPGFVAPDPDSLSLTKMRRGTQVEEDNATALVAWLEERGFKAQRDYRIAWKPEAGRGAFRRLLPAGHCAGCDKCIPREGEMIGHLDVFAEREQEDGGVYRVVYEIKSTVFYGKPPDEPSPHHKEQCYVYGVAVGADEAHLLVECRATGKRKKWTMDLDKLEFVAIARAKAVLEYTDPQALTPPEARPRYGWQKNYCAMGKDCPCKKAEER